MSNGPAEQDFFAASEAAVADTQLRRKLENATGRHLDHVAATRADFPAYEDERDASRRIKEDSIARLDDLLAQLKERLEANGCRVFVAANAAEARKYIVDLARERGAHRVIKGKSMATEEIALNSALAEAGCEVVETDLGEYIVQLRGERPSHIITPAIHLSKEDIGLLFNEKLHVPYTSEPTALTALARERLREVFLAAEMGVTGVNFAIAETGTLVLVENEGNGRMSSTLPEVLVAVMGIEKVIPSMADLSHFLEVLARTATGQKLTTYTNFISGPRRAGEADGPREVHVVMLDNGRSAMLADPVLREALYCLRCGACLNVCPIYRRVGGHAYGSTYPGPIGSIVSPSLFGGATAALPFASTLCGACREICPVKIDIPRILLHLRWKETAAKETTDKDAGTLPTPIWPRAARRARSGVRMFSRMANHPLTARVMGRMAALVMWPFARRGYVRWMPPPFSSWTRVRDFPVPRFRRRRKAPAPLKPANDGTQA
ncbi:MAG TPA: LutB/LldF family L-lactate oxidation iron-sulfur protein [Candidatus Binataceae bacterium]|nr:LutB/LldF family L-lactate oxidation iron-sulfur protein [Candidatus Binataceae bacterium]